MADPTRTPDPAPPRPPEPAADRAYAFAKQRILGGHWSPGDLISEGEVADATGLSRTPVREAFLRLQAEGALRLQPKRGALVTPVSVTEIREVLEARLLIETFAGEQVIAGDPAARAELAGRLAASLDRQRAARDAADHDAFVAEDRRFHELVVTAAGNSLLSGFYETLRDRQMRLGLRALTSSAGRFVSIDRQHAALVEIIATGTVAGFRQAAADHVGGTRAALLGLPEPGLS